MTVYQSIYDKATTVVGYLVIMNSTASIQGWGLVRSEHPSMRPSAAMARVVQWDSFHIFGSVHGLDITNNSTITKWVWLVNVVAMVTFLTTKN